MDQKQIFKQMIDFNKATFNNSFSALMMLQDQMENLAGTMLDQATWLPEDGRKAVSDWVEACKKGRTDFKTLVDEGFEKMEAYF